MPGRRTFVAALVSILFFMSIGFGESLEDNWNDFLHYTKIGRLDLAKGYAQAVLDGKPDPAELLALSTENPQGYAIVLKVNEVGADAELTELSGKILAIIEQGTFARRTDPKIIVEEIKRLSGTTRGRLAAVKRLANSGEYAIPYMLDAMADDARKDELSNIIWALPQVGKDAIRPLAAALQSEDVAIKIEIIKALGMIGYPQALPYLKYVVEKNSSAELTKTAQRSIRQIDKAAMEIPAAHLFYQLGEKYYYNSDSLTPAETADVANMWFWDASGRRLVGSKVDKRYFNELMAMRSCEWALKADAGFGRAIGLWLAAYSKAETVGVELPAYFSDGQAPAIVYATTAGPEYLHSALARALRDKDAQLALCMVEALATTAGERSLFYRVATDQPLIDALSFDDKTVRYSAAVAMAAAGAKEKFAESRIVVENLAKALKETELSNKWVSQSYALRAAKVMFKLAQTQNTAINLSSAEEALVDATKSENVEIKILAARTLAVLDSSSAQSAVAAMALSQENSVAIRVAAFEALGTSAKLNGSMLDDSSIDAVYKLVGSQDAQAELRSAAAAAYGALNLPSQKVKDLILDKAKS